MACCMGVFYVCSNVVMNPLETEERLWCAMDIPLTTMAYGSPTLATSFMEERKPIVPYSMTSACVPIYANRYGSGRTIQTSSAGRVQSYSGGLRSVSTESRVNNRSLQSGMSQMIAHNLQLPMIVRNGLPAVEHTPTRPINRAPRAASAANKAPQSSRTGFAQTVQPTQTFEAVKGLSLGYASATQYMSSPMRKPPTTGSSWEEWLREVNGDNPYVDMSTLYDKWQDQQGSTNMPNGGTWDDFTTWFESEQNTYYRVPVGNGAGWLVLLVGVYMIVIYLKDKTNKSIERQ